MRTLRSSVVKALILGVGLAACGSQNSALEASDEYSCFRDDDCSEGMVCFADGCADPGQDIVVELTPAAAKGIHAQDFPFDRINSTLDFHVSSATAFQGALLLTSASGTAPYGGGVSIRCSGESNLIPGQVRRFETTAAQTGGTYDLPVASGRYIVVATPTDLAVPPVVAGPEAVAAGESKVLNLDFPSGPDVLTLQAKLVRTASPAEELLPPGVTMEALAVHPTSGQPLSQRVEIAANGQFTLAISPSARTLGTFQLRVNPKSMGAQSGQVAIPSKVFSVSPTQLPALLELGAYGAPITLTGNLLSDEGEPVVGASVSVEGAVTGGGTFRSASVLTGFDGGFQLSTLPNAADKRLVLVAAPPSTSDVGILQMEVNAPAGAPLALGAVLAPRKVPVRGRVSTFEGDPAVSVRVRAVPLEPARPGHALPQGAETTTESDGKFELNLDPAALYRLDYVPIFGNTPRASRFLTLQRDPGSSDSRIRPEELPELSLSRGRRVSGMVRSVQSRNSADVSAAPYAQVRFFRRVSLDGKTSSLLIAEGTTDATGHYEVLLPSR